MLLIMLLALLFMLISLRIMRYDPENKSKNKAKISAEAFLISLAISLFANIFIYNYLPKTIEVRAEKLAIGPGNEFLSWTKHKPTWTVYRFYTLQDNGFKKEYSVDSKFVTIVENSEANVVEILENGPRKFWRVLAYPFGNEYNYRILIVGQITQNLP